MSGTGSFLNTLIVTDVTQILMHLTWIMGEI